MPKLDENDFVEPKNLPDIRTPDVALNSVTNIGQQFNQNAVTEIDRNVAAEYNAASNADVLVKNSNEDWINKRWRPMMGWMYTAVCVCDFILFPILWSVIQVISGAGVGEVKDQWDPLTLQGAGLFHIAMGAVLGIAVYGRTKEKLEIKQ